MSQQKQRTSDLSRWTNRVHTGDSMELLNQLPEDSIHAIVTDPPYNFEGGFMNRDWDNVGSNKEFERWCEQWASKALSAIRPGGHLLAFGGSQTFHRLMCGIEDAGFDIRTVIVWLYGCLSEDTEVLTPDGWRSHNEIAEGDDVIAFDPSDGTFETEPTRRVFRYEHDGSMVRYQSPHTDQLVTPNHRVLHRENGWETTYAAHSHGNMELPVVHASSQIQLPGGKNLSNLLLNVGSHHVERGRKQRDVLARLWERHSGMDATRGIERPALESTEGTRRAGGGGVCKLWRGEVETTGSCRWKQLLRPSVLRRMGEHGRNYPGAPERDSSLGCRRVDFRISRIVPREDDRREQPIVERWRDLQAPEGQLQARDHDALPAGVLGDGTGERIRARTSVSCGEGTRQAAGERGVRSSDRPRQPQQRPSEPRTLPEQQDAQVGGRGPGGVRIGTTLARTTQVDYSGTVWCVNVPSSYFVARRNGQVFITGNSGFPKSLDASKAIDDLLFRDWLDTHHEERDRLAELDSGSDEHAELEAELRKRAGVKREEIGVKPGHEEFAGRTTNGHLGGEGTNESYKRPWMEGNDADSYHVATAPGSEEAKEWDGWKTALKPAVEFVTVARAPLEGHTVAENILRYGTGALNIRPSRIEITDGGGSGNWSSEAANTASAWHQSHGGLSGGVKSEMDDDGRYPPNLVLTQHAARTLDEATGDTTSADGTTHTGQNRSLGPNGLYGDGERENDDVHSYDDEGGPSRYFKITEDADHTRFKYTSKASKNERTLNGRIENEHPSVKPLDLCEWLVRLVAAPDQIVLDPFCGTGTMLRASRDLGRNFIGMEMDPLWSDVARVRAGLTPENPRVLTSDGQTALAQFAPDRSTGTESGQ